MAKTKTEDELEGGEDLGVFVPDEHEQPPPPATIPELAAFRDKPSKETHLAAAKLLHRTGPLVLDGELFELVKGRVGRSSPRPSRQDVVIPDDPTEIL